MSAVVIDGPTRYILHRGLWWEGIEGGGGGGGGLPEAIRVSIMFPAGRFRLQDSSTDADSSGITMFTSYSMYLKPAQRRTQSTRHELPSVSGQSVSTALLLILAKKKTHTRVHTPR